MGKLLILGAGIFQINAIRLARSLGHHVISLDNIPGNIGHSFSNESVYCDTTDMRAVTRIAKSMSIDRICTFSSDAAVPSVAHTCRALGLPGLAPKTAKRLCRKDRFRIFQRDNGLRHPYFVILDKTSDPFIPLDRIDGKMVAKPVDSSGSRGVTIVDRYMPQSMIQNAIDHAFSFSKCGVICLETFLPGIEYGGDGIMRNGKLAFAAITNKHKSDEGFVVLGHSLRCRLNDPAQKLVREEIERHCIAAEYKDGPINYDVMLYDGAAYILEMSPRNGGNGIPGVIKHATGIDIEKQTIAFALGNEPRLDRQLDQYAGSVIFGSSRNGFLSKYESEENIRTAIPSIHEFTSLMKPGMRVDSLKHNGNLLGYAVFSLTPGDTYEHVSARILDKLNITIN